jgi:hypothetical protein
MLPGGQAERRKKKGLIRILVYVHHRGQRDPGGCCRIVGMSFAFIDHHKVFKFLTVIRKTHTSSWWRLSFPNPSVVADQRRELRKINICATIVVHVGDYFVQVNLEVELFDHAPHLVEVYLAVTIRLSPNGDEGLKKIVVQSLSSQLVNPLRVKSLASFKEDGEVAKAKTAFRCFKLCQAGLFGQGLHRDLQTGKQLLQVVEVGEVAIVDIRFPHFGRILRFYGSEGCA